MSEDHDGDEFEEYYGRNEVDFGRDEDSGGAGIENEVETVTDTQELVNEALRRVPSDVLIELRPCDIEEDKVVEDFMSKGCGCKKWNGKACSEQFSIDYVKQLRVNIRELTTSELDLVIMGQLMANSNTSATSQQRGKSHTPAIYIRARSSAK